MRLSAIGLLAKPASRKIAGGDGNPRDRRRLYSQGAWRDVDVFDRSSLQSSVSLDGPVVIEEAHSTIMIPGGWSVRQVETGELIAITIGVDRS